MTDTLSAELIETIIMELEEYDITAEPDAKVFRPMLNVATADSSDEDGPESDDDNDDLEDGHLWDDMEIDLDNASRVQTWTLLTKAARTDIKHTRLVCRKFRKGADRSFVKLLEERPFGATQFDLEILVAIGQDTQLANWFHALTLDCGPIVHTDDNGNDTDSPHAQDGLYAPNISLATALRAFRNVGSIRMVTRNHAGQYIEGPCSDIHVFQQLRHAGVQIFDFRFSTGFGLDSYLQARILPDLSMLRVLRVEIVAHSPLWANTLGISPLESLLTSAISLEDVALSLARTVSQVEDTPNAHAREYALRSTQLFRMLLTHTKLRRLGFMEGWVFESEHLIAFVKAHVTTIRSLLFERPSMNSADPYTWVSALGEVARATKGTLEYLYMDTPMYWKHPHCMCAEMDAEDLAEFDCVVDFCDETGQRIEPAKPEEEDTKVGGTNEEAAEDD
jgi:hypothetical protein